MTSPLHDRGVIARYREYLPVTDATPVVSLNEGSTPLIYSPRLSALVGRGCEVYVKYEGLNPTGSFKDRGMTVAISKAVEEGSQGRHLRLDRQHLGGGGGLCGAGGHPCIVLLPAGKIAMGKLAQAFMYGAKVVAIDGNFDDALRLVREIGETEPIVHRQLDQSPPDRGTKDRLLRDHRGAGRRARPAHPARRQRREHHRVLEGLPGISREGPGVEPAAMLGFQAAGAAPIYHDKIVRIPRRSRAPSASAIPASWQLAAAAIRESRGAIDIVTDLEILDAQRFLAAREGIFVEPASAASIAGLLKCLGKERCAACPCRPSPKGRASSAPSPATA